MNLSSNLFGNSNDVTNFSHKLLLTSTYLSKIFANDSLANTKFSKIHLRKMTKSGEVIPGIPIFGNGLSSAAKKEQM